jgi:hypothetical protein
MPMKTVMRAAVAALSLGVVLANAAPAYSGSAPHQEGNAFNSVQGG